MGGVWVERQESKTQNRGNNVAGPTTGKEESGGGQAPPRPRSGSTPRVESNARLKAPRQDVVCEWEPWTPDGEPRGENAVVVKIPSTGYGSQMGIWMSTLRTTPRTSIERVFSKKGGTVRKGHYYYTKGK